MPDAAVQTHVSDAVRTVAFDRPADLNALTADDLNEATRLTEKPGSEVRALVFTGSGDRAFTAGMHVASFMGIDSAGGRDLIRRVRDFLGAVRTSPLPTAAMINGYCLGAGFELALACDLRISVETAKFGLPEVKVGVPSVVDAALLQEHVGLSLAKEIILTGDLYPADMLAERGLFNQVVPRESLQERTLEWLGRITRHTRTVVASQKRLFEVWQNAPLRLGIESSVDEFAGVFEADETLEQIQSYQKSLK
jgi:enoyl-CoA hydratase/carnithine racemase